MFKYNDSESSKTYLAVSINLGTLIGCYVFSYLIGSLGRAKTFKLTVLISTIGGIFICLLPNYEILLIGLFVIGLGMGGDSAISTTVFMESIPYSQHKYLTILNISYCFGTAISICFAILLEFRLQTHRPSWLILT